MIVPTPSMAPTRIMPPPFESVEEVVERAVTTDPEICLDALEDTDPPEDADPPDQDAISTSPGSVRAITMAELRSRRETPLGPKDTTPGTPRAIIRKPGANPPTVASVPAIDKPTKER